MDTSEEEKLDEEHEKEKQLAHQFLALSDQTWAEHLKDKMKKHFEKERGDKMDKIAEVCVKASLSIWDKKMNGEDVKKDFNDFSGKLDRILKS